MRIVYRVPEFLYSRMIWVQEGEATLYRNSDALQTIIPLRDSAFKIQPTIISRICSAFCTIGIVTVYD